MWGLDGRCPDRLELGGGLPPGQKAHADHSRTAWLLPQLVLLSYSDQVQRPLGCILGPRKPQQGQADADKLTKLHILYRVRTRTGPQAPPQPRHPAHLHHARARRRLGMQERASHPNLCLPVCLPGGTAAPHSQQQGPGKAQASGL